MARLILKYFDILPVLHRCGPVPLPLKKKKKGLTGFFPPVNKLINVDFTPTLLLPQYGCMLGCRQTKQDEGVYMSGVDGQGSWVGWAGLGRAEIIGGVMFHPGNPARGGFSLCSLVASAQSRRHLASWNATEQRGGAGGGESVLCQRGGEGCGGDMEYLQQGY